MSEHTITDFLEARIAEDEAAAERCASAFVVPDAVASTMLDPSRVLAECAAKRALLREHFLAHWASVPEGCRVCRTYDATPDLYPCNTVRHLAAVYADHADFRQEWKL